MSRIAKLRLLRLVLVYLWVRKFRKFRNPARLLKWQRRRTERLLRTLTIISPFFRRFSDVSFECLPIINRATYATNFDELNTRGLRQVDVLSRCRDAEVRGVRAGEMAGCTVGLSSGTSEGRGVFLVTPAEREFHSAHFLAKLLRGSLLSSQRIAYFIRADADLYDTAQGKRMRFQHFAILDRVEDQIARLVAFDPTVLFAPASTLRKLGEFRRAGILEFPSLRQILTGAEALDPLDRYHLERDFGLRLDQVYQCTEGFIAFTCVAGEWHLNEDLVRIEKDYLDAERRRFAPIVTDLYRLAQPYVRYRISDVLLESAVDLDGLCACGRGLARFTAVTGREADLIRVLHSASNAEPEIVFHDEIQALFFAFRNELSDYQVIQRGSGARSRLVVQLRAITENCADDLARRVKVAIEAFLASRDLRVDAVDFAPYVDVPAPKKLRRIRRED